jgi:hypothetical protein
LIQDGRSTTFVFAETKIRESRILSHNEMFSEAMGCDGMVLNSTCATGVQQFICHASDAL